LNKGTGINQKYLPGTKTGEGIPRPANSAKTVMGYTQDYFWAALWRNAADQIK